MLADEPEEPFPNVGLTLRLYGWLNHTMFALPLCPSAVPLPTLRSLTESGFPRSSRWPSEPRCRTEQLD